MEHERIWQCSEFGSVQNLSITDLAKIFCLNWPVSFLTGLAEFEQALNIVTIYQLL